MSESFESGAQRETVANPKLRELFTEAENGLYACDPVADAEAHGPGSRFLDRVSNLHDPFPLDPEARTKLQNENNKLLNNLAVVNLDGLSPQEHTMFDMLQHDTVNRINLLRLSTAYRRPIDHTSASVPWALQNDASGEGRIHFETPLDLDCFYNQLQGFPEWTTKALRSMYKAIEEGETQPQVIMQQVQKQLEMLLSDEGTAQAAFSRPLDLVAGSEPWRKPYHEVITQSVLPAYKTLLSFTYEHMPHFRDDRYMGLCHIPAGEVQYKNLLRYYTSYEHVDIAALRYKAAERFEEVVWQLNEIKQKVSTTRELTLSEFLRYADQNALPDFQSAQEIEQVYRHLDSRVSESIEAVFVWSSATPFDIPQNGPGHI